MQDVVKPLNQVADMSILLHF